jgi:hypothetical protein
MKISFKMGVLNEKRCKKGKTKTVAVWLNLSTFQKVEQNIWLHLF